MDDLHDELILECLKYFTLKEFKIFCLVCTRFRKIAVMHEIPKLCVYANDLSKIRLPICVVRDLYIKSPDEKFAKFIESNELIKNVHIDETVITDKIMINACCTKLKSIKSNLYTYLNESSSHLSLCSALEIVRLYTLLHTTINVSIFESFGNCPLLHTIETDSKQLFDENVKILSEKCNLQIVHFTHCEFLTDKSLHYLSNCKNLTSVQFSHNKNISDSGISFLSNNHRLEMIDFSFCQHLTDKSIEIFSHFPLNALRISDLKNITDLGLNSLLHHPTLCKIDLNKCLSLSNNIGEILSTCQNLREINVDGINLNQTFFKSIEKNKSITKVYYCDVAIKRNKIDKIARGEMSFCDLCPRYKYDVTSSEEY